MTEYRILYASELPSYITYLNEQKKKGLVLNRCTPTSQTFVESNENLFYRLECYMGYKKELLDKESFIRMITDMDGKIVHQVSEFYLVAYPSEPEREFPRHQNMKIHLLAEFMGQFIIRAIFVAISMVVVLNFFSRMPRSIFIVFFWTLIVQVWIEIRIIYNKKFHQGRFSRLNFKFGYLYNLIIIFILGIITFANI